MKKIIIIILGVAVVGGYVVYKFKFLTKSTLREQNSGTASAPRANVKSNSKIEIENSQPGLTPSLDNKSADVEVVAQGLDTPWAIAFLPDGGILVTERPGRVRLVNTKGQLEPMPVATLLSVKEIGEGGLLGLALDPDFASKPFVYLYYTYSESGGRTLNRMVRMKYEPGKLGEETVLVDRIPGAANHNGGRIKFGPDGYLYITTGDAQNPSQAQDTTTLAGKILRVTDTGQAAPGNPFGNLVYTFGHRNPQGLAWDDTGRLWATEHGRSGIQSGLDEVNIIEAGKNYGWPTIQGDQTREGMVGPAANSGPAKTWAPAGAAITGGSLFFGGLRGEAVYEAILDGGRVAEVKEHYKGQYGRIREVITGPDGRLYITTSNRDGRGNPAADDDRIISIKYN